MKVMTYRTGLSLLIGASVALGACARAPESAAASTPLPVSAQPASQEPASHEPAAPAPASAAVAAVPRPAAGWPKVLVHKSPSCGCCGLWVEHLRRSGFPVEVRNEDNLNPTKQRLGVPHGKGSCHTAEVDGYVIEGHVPVQDIQRLLAERPRARGLVLPGMPAGSPGMEMPDGRVDPYTVELVSLDGCTRPFAHHGGAATP